MQSCQPIIFGNSRFLESLAEDLGLEVAFDRILIEDVGEYRYPPAWGTISRSAGDFALRCLTGACRSCRNGASPVLITAPIHKGAAVAAGMKFPGQTEFVSSFFPGCESAMAFFSDRFHLLLVTVHLALREVFDCLSKDLIVRKGRLFFKSLRSLGLKRPRVAVCGLNPHASESGLFGTEEAEFIEPAVQQLISEFGLDSFAGPLAADTVFRLALNGRYDGVVALYHDQGLAPLKVVAFDSAVNATLGLPVVRTSPAHGTAFDLAGLGKADPGSMIAAIRWGIRLTDLVKTSGV